MSNKQTEQFIEHQQEIKEEKEYYQALESWKEEVKKYLDNILDRNRETLIDLEHIKDKLIRTELKL